MKKQYLLFLIALMSLSSCQGESSSQEVTSEPSNVASEPALSSETPVTSSESLSSEDTQSSEIVTSEHELTSEEKLTSEPISSEVPPIYNPEIPGLTFSSSWPEAELNAYLTYASNIDTPVLYSNGAGYHHGIYDSEELGEYYRIVIRVAFESEITGYINLLSNDYDFSVESVVELPGLYYAESQYDDVRIYFEYHQAGNIREIIFDFFDGSGDNYDGPTAVDGLAYFDLTTRVALTSNSATRAKWEVRPATFTVYKSTSGYNVGNTNGEHLSNPLRIYPGQEAKFTVSDNYYIQEIKILAASGYAEETVLNGEFTNGAATNQVDFVLITPIGQPSEIEYKLTQVQYVGQVRWLNIQLKLVKR